MQFARLASFHAIEFVDRPIPNTLDIIFIVGLPLAFVCEISVYDISFRKTVFTKHNICKLCCLQRATQFPRYKQGTPGTMTPLLATKTLAFYDSGFPTEARLNTRN